MPQGNVSIGDRLNKSMFAYRKSGSFITGLEKLIDSKNQLQLFHTGQWTTFRKGFGICLGVKCIEKHYRPFRPLVSPLIHTYGHSTLSFIYGHLPASSQPRCSSCLPSSSQSSFSLTDLLFFTYVFPFGCLHCFYLLLLSNCYFLTQSHQFHPWAVPKWPSKSAIEKDVLLEQMCA